MQRNLLAHVLVGLPVSPHATAYRKGVGILQNAAPHAGKAIILRLDIADFFPSITFAMVYARAFPRAYFPPAAAALLTSLCCCRDTLPQGAPTSPAISNLVMRPFDSFIGKWCAELGITYTRYCDDMIFSGDFDAYMVERKVEGLLSLMGFSLNRKKTRVYTPANRQQVTGIVVNRHPQASREYRRALRQELHYCAKFGVDSHLERTLAHRACKEEQLRYLQAMLGRVAFVLQLNAQDAFFQEARMRIRGWIHALQEV